MSDQQLMPLPASWATARVGEVASVNPKSDRSLFQDQLEVQFVPMAAVGAATGVVELSEVRTFAEVQKGFTPFRAGDVLFAKITPCMENGKMAVVPELRNGIGFGSTEFHVLRPHEGISASYLYYFVSSERVRRNAEHNMTGAVGQRRVPTTYLSQHVLPLPPANEQLRIVAKLEELFSELDKGTESLLRARAQLDLYRAVVLNAAIRDESGKSFPTKLLSKLIGRINQGWSPKCELNRTPQDSEWAIIKTTAIQPMRYDGMECKPLPKGLEPRANIEIRDGDLLMTRKGPRPRTGVVCFVKKTRPRSMLCDTVYRFRCNEELVLPEYLELALNSPRLVQEINSRKSGISESGISLNHGKLATIPVPVPLNREHQKAIVLRAQERLSQIDNIEAVVAEQIRRSETLRQAILQRAFRGDLVAQDPSDEPASVLLDRIGIEEEDSGKKTKKKNKHHYKEAA